jgi:hypothetical protein
MLLYGSSGGNTPDNVQLENNQLKEHIQQLGEVISRWKRLSNELYRVCIRVATQTNTTPNRTETTNNHQQQSSNK